MQHREQEASSASAVLLCCVFPTLSHTHTHTLSLFPFLSFPFSAAVERLTIAACFTFAPLHDLGLTCIGSICYLAFLFPELTCGPFVHHTLAARVFFMFVLLASIIPRSFYFC